MTNVPISLLLPWTLFLQLHSSEVQPNYYSSTWESLSSCSREIWQFLNPSILLLLLPPYCGHCWIETEPGSDHPSSTSAMRHLPYAAVAGFSMASQALSLNQYTRNKCLCYWLAAFSLPNVNMHPHCLKIKPEINNSSFQLWEFFLKKHHDAIFDWLWWVFSFIYSFINLPFFAWSFSLPNNCPYTKPHVSARFDYASRQHRPKLSQRQQKGNNTHHSIYKTAFKFLITESGALSSFFRRHWNTYWGFISKTSHPFYI